jgi:hypothetical protein
MSGSYIAGDSPIGGQLSVLESIEATVRLVGSRIILGPIVSSTFWVVAFIFDPIFGDLWRERRPYDQELGLGLFQPPSFSAYPFSVDGLRFHRVRAAPALCAFHCAH